MRASINDRVKMRATPTTGESGSNVIITPTLETGVKIADYEIDGETGALYSPSPTSYSMIKHVLYEDEIIGTNPANVAISYNNNYSLSDYDLVIVYYGDQLDVTYFFGTVIIPSLNLTDVIYCGYSSRVNRTRFDDKSFTQITITVVGEDGRYAPHVYKIVGIKLGAIV